jgi:hypothetical protein
LQFSLNPGASRLSGRDAFFCFASFIDCPLQFISPFVLRATIRIMAILIL